MEAVSEGPAYRQELLRFLAGELRPRSCQGRLPAEAVGLFSGWIFTQMETADALPYHST